MADATGMTTYTYTDVGQIASVQKGNGQTLGYHYDDAGQLTTITYPGGHDVDYTYDDAGEMTSVTGWASGTTAYTYTADGNLSARMDPNGVTESRTYDLAGRLTGIEGANAATTFVDYGYTYDDAGQLVTTTMTDALHATTTQQWGYDPIGQLATTAPSVGYTASAAGLLTETPAGDSLSYNTAGQLTGLANAGTGTAAAFSYDDNGARTGSVTDYSTGPDLTIGYDYNRAGSLTGYTDGANSLGYTVDGDGLRQFRSDGATSNDFLWDTVAALPLLLSDGDHFYIYGPSLTPIAQIGAAGAVEYLYSDNIGSVRTISNSTGAVVSSADYDPYGIVLTHTGTSKSKIGYAGAWTDPVSGLIYLRARDYEPTTGQFIVTDPVVTQTRQPYAYVGNAPLGATDPSGLCEGLDCLSDSYFWAGLGPSIDQQMEIAHAGFSGGSTFGIGLLTNNDVACYGSNPMFWVEYGLGAMVSLAAILASGGKSLQLQLGARAPELQALYRVVGAEELASIEASGSYSLIAGLEGKYFFPTLEQAVNLVGHYSKFGQQGITSGTIARSLIPVDDMIAPAGEGIAFFLRGEELIGQIANVVIHGG
jgi:RHS repeat-associated protein